MLRNNVAFQNQGTMRMMKTNTYIQGNQVHILNRSFSILEPDNGNSLSDLHTGRKQGIKPLLYHTVPLYREGAGYRANAISCKYLKKTTER